MKSSDLEVPIDSLVGGKNLHTYPLLALQILKPDNKTKSKAKPKGNLSLRLQLKHMFPQILKDCRCLKRKCAEN